MEVRARADQGRSALHTGGCLGYWAARPSGGAAATAHAAQLQLAPACPRVRASDLRRLFWAAGVAATTRDHAPPPHAAVSRRRPAAGVPFGRAVSGIRSEPTSQLSRNHLSERGLAWLGEGVRGQVRRRLDRARAALPRRCSLNGAGCGWGYRRWGRAACFGCPRSSSSRRLSAAVGQLRLSLSPSHLTIWPGARVGAGDRKRPHR